MAKELPQAFHQSIFRFFKKEDQYNALIGKLMVKHHLLQLGYSGSKLEDWQTNQYGKPLLPTVPSFNISHAKGAVVCAWADQPNAILGIDIELIREIELESFQNCFVAHEWADIIESLTPLQKFYQYWTMKEAFIKADGRGLSLEPSKVITDNIKAKELGKSTLWYFHELQISTSYKCCVCTVNESEELNVMAFSYS